MPADYEPCGIGQLIAMRYGAVPVVRETGGLKDTVQQYDKYTNTGNGFLFSNYKAHELMYPLKRSAGNNQPEITRRFTNGCCPSAPSEQAAESFCRPVLMGTETKRRDFDAG